MGPLFLQTDISEDRIRNHGQPDWETIGLDAFVRMPQLLRHAYAETVRFGDFKRSGDASVRYYHFPSFNRGQVLGIPAVGHSRFMSGLYENRQVLLSKSVVPVQDVINREEDRTRPLMLASHSMVQLAFGGESLIIARVNCLEVFPDCYLLSASLRIPESLFFDSVQSLEFDKLLAEHDSFSKPVVQHILCQTIDASLVVSVGRGVQARIAARLQFTSDRSIQLLEPKVWVIP